MNKRNLDIQSKGPQSRDLRNGQPWFEITSFLLKLFYQIYHIIQGHYGSKSEKPTSEPYGDINKEDRPGGQVPYIVDDNF